MTLQFEVTDPFGAVPEGDRFVIADTKETEAVWRALSADFAASFERSLGVAPEDFEFADWHHGMMVLFVYLYSEAFYYAEFIAGVIEILHRHGECYAEFECYGGDGKLCGSFMVFKTGRVLLSPLSSRTGLSDRLRGVS